MNDRHARIVGIDLGTTFSLVAALNDGVPRILPNVLGETLTPSAVSVADNGAILVGAAARARATTRPGSTAVSFKRDMGTDRAFNLDGRPFSAPELSALVLRSLREDAEEALGYAIDEAVVTVPAYFGDAQRQATRTAGEIAGLRVERIINEPTAAALAYGLHNRERELRVAVLDLGGGTFDVTILEIIEGIIEIHSSAGDTRLGGDDFDSALADMVAERTLASSSADIKRNKVSWARLRDACEGAKKRLSTQENTFLSLYQVGVAGDSREVDIEARISREEAESCWQPLLDRMRTPVERALRDATTTAGTIDEVLLVGGATRIPCVVRLAAQMFGRVPLRTLPPDEAVALGAAVQAGLKAGDCSIEDMVVTDVAPFTLGTSASSGIGSRFMSGLFIPIIERGTVIPCSRAKQFVTTMDSQQCVRVDAYQGEHPLVRDNQRLGAYVVDGLRLLPAGEEVVEIRFSYDLNGILEVETTIPATGARKTLVIEQTPGRMTPEEIDAARQKLARLKFHPRDALPNATLLARADALYVELRGEERDELGQAIACFSGALDSQQDSLIAEARAILTHVTESLMARLSS